MTDGQRGDEALLPERERLDPGHRRRQRPVDDQVVNDIPWCSEDMVTYEQSIREGWFDVCSKDVQRLTGRRPKSLEEVLLGHIKALNAA